MVHIVPGSFFVPGAGLCQTTWPDPSNFARKFDCMRILFAFRILIPLTFGTMAYPS